MDSCKLVKADAQGPGIGADMKEWLCRSTLRNPDPWLVDAFTGGRTSASGEVVNPSTSLGLSAYFASIRAISEDEAKLPFPVFKRTGDRNKDRVQNHFVSRLLNDEPNPEMSGMQWREAMGGNAMGWGGGFSEIVRDGLGRAVELWPLSPDSVSIQRQRTGFVNGVPQFTLVYRVTRKPGDSPVILDQSSVFHLHGFGFDGITGYSVAQLAKQSIGLGLATEKSGASFFGNSSRPDGILVTPEGKNLKKNGRENLKKAWDATYGGAGKSHQTAVLEGGVKWQSISIPNEDAQWIETRQFNVEDIARWFRIPPHKIQHLLRSTFSNIEQQSIEYVTDTLMAWLVRWEKEVQRKLIPEDEKDTFFAEHIIEGLLRGDIDTRFKAYSTARQWGWFSVNDIRALENLNGIGEKGDVYLVPLNMQSATDALKPPTTPSEPAVPSAGAEPSDDEPTSLDQASLKLLVAEETRRQTREPVASASLPQKLAETNLPLLTAAYERALRIEIDKAERASKNGGVKRWADKFYLEPFNMLGNTLDEAVRAYCGSVWAAMKGTPLTAEVESVIRVRTEGMVERHLDRSIADVDAAFALEDFAPMLATWRGDRAATVARAEIADLAYFMSAMCGKREE